MLLLLMWNASWVFGLLVNDFGLLKCLCVVYTVLYIPHVRACLSDPWQNLFIGFSTIPLLDQP
jgi:hypothetical protein